MAETIFHKIIKREIPASIVFEDEQVVAFKDINAVAPTHVLIVPKKTIAKLSDLTPNDEQLIGHMHVIAAQIAKENGLTDYRTVCNCGSEAGQSVFQLHLHLMGGRSFSWPPG